MPNWLLYIVMFFPLLLITGGCVYSLTLSKDGREAFWVGAFSIFNPGLLDDWHEKQLRQIKKRKIK